MYAGAIGVAPGLGECCWEGVDICLVVLGIGWGHRWWLCFCVSEVVYIYITIQREVMYSLRVT